MSISNMPISPTTYASYPNENEETKQSSFLEAVDPIFAIMFIRAAYEIGLANIHLLILSTIAHEQGHSIVIKRFDNQAKPTQFWGLEGYAKLSDDKYFSPSQKILVSIAGPFVNFCLFLIGLVGSKYFLNPYLSQPATLLAKINLQLFRMNCLPLSGIDGGWVMVGFFEKFNEEKGMQDAYLIQLIGSIFFLFYSRGTLLSILSLLRAYVWFENTRIDILKLRQAQECIEKGDTRKAEKRLLAVIKQEKHNILGLKASFVLSQLYQKQKQIQRAYDTLSFYQSHLNETQKKFFLDLKAQLENS